MAGFDVALHLARDCLWVVCRWPGRHGIALRTAYTPAGRLALVDLDAGHESALVRMACPLGAHTVQVGCEPGSSILRVTTAIRPNEPLMLPYWPRDLVPFGPDGDPLTARGAALAGQPDTSAAVSYATFDPSTPGSFLYFQDLTCLNEFSNLTDTTPTERTGGIWPEVGFQPAVVDRVPLPAGRQVIVSAPILNLNSRPVADAAEAAQLFLELIEGIYWRIDRPAVRYHDWPALAERTVRDLTSSGVLVKQSGHSFLNPYVESGPPDSMVQLTVLRALADYEDWTGKAVPLARTLRAGIEAFFDPSVGALRRYLPGVEGKDYDQVDGWYLYHPLLHLAHLVRRGDGAAKEIYQKCLDHAIRTARHFKYIFPVMWHMETLEVQRPERKEGEPGQSDVCGLYAYVMTDAWNITGRQRYLDEACRRCRTRPIRVLACPGLAERV